MTLGTGTLNVYSQATFTTSSLSKEALDHGGLRREFE